MSYVRPNRTSAAGRNGSGRAMGEASPPFAPSVSDVYRALASQVNRFGPSAPSGYQFAQKVFPLAAFKLEPDLALTALLIYQRRATDAYNQFGDESSAQAIAKANAGFADPVGFVSGSLGEVTQVIANFADSLGLAPPAGEAGSKTAVVGGTAMMVAGVALALWAVTLLTKD